MPLSQAKAEERAKAYTEAWCSHVPEGVASFYAEDGCITINGGKPSNGRGEVAEMARDPGQYCSEEPLELEVTPPGFARPQHVDEFGYSGMGCFEACDAVFLGVQLAFQRA